MLFFHNTLHRDIVCVCNSENMSMYVPTDVYRRPKSYRKTFINIAAANSKHNAILRKFIQVLRNFMSEIDLIVDCVYKKAVKIACLYESHIRLSIDPHICMRDYERRSYMLDKCFKLFAQMDLWIMMLLNTIWIGNDIWNWLMFNWSNQIMKTALFYSL